jgi:hypothetical protein
VSERGHDLYVFVSRRGDRLKRRFTELHAHPRGAADLRDQPTTMCRDERCDLVEPPLRLLDVSSATGIAGLPAHALPDRDRHVARQTIAIAFAHRIEPRVVPLPLDLRRMHHARRHSPASFADVVVDVVISGAVRSRPHGRVDHKTAVDPHDDLRSRAPTGEPAAPRSR